MEAKIKNYLNLAGLFTALLLSYLAAGGTLKAFAQDNQLLAAALMLCNSLFFSACTLLLYRKCFQQVPVWCRPVRGILVSVLLSGALIAFLYLFYRLDAAFSFFAANWPSCILLAAAAGIAEEVMFRGFLFDYVNKEASALWGFIVISVLFGALHILNFLSGEQVSALYIFNCMAAGLFLCVLYYKYGLVPALIYHISWNAVFADNTVESLPLTGIALLAAAAGILLLEKKLKPSARSKR